jgi:hypothetical protein
VAPVCPGAVVLPPPLLWVCPGAAPELPGAVVAVLWPGLDCFTVCPGAVVVPEPEPVPFVVLGAPVVAPLVPAAGAPLAGGAEVTGLVECDDEPEPADPVPAPVRDRDPGEAERCPAGPDPGWVPGVWVSCAAAVEEARPAVEPEAALTALPAVVPGAGVTCAVDAFGAITGGAAWLPSLPRAG